MSGRPQPHVQDRAALLRAHILAGGTPKEFAFTHRVSIAVVGKQLGALGLRKYFLSLEEYQRVMSARRRKNLAKAA